MLRKPIEAIVCGGTRVYLFIPESTGDRPRIWDAVSAPGLKSSEREWFRAMDECKPSPCGTKLLLSSSDGGGVAVVSQDTFACLFAAHLPNAHSLEIAAGGWIVAAGSIGSDRLVVYDPESREAVSEFPLRHGHGVVRDERRGVLWACGGKVLLSLTIDGEGHFREHARFALPEDGAHDLVPARTLKHLDISTSHAVWRFDIASERFDPHPVLGGRAHVKSIDENSAGRLVFQQAPAETGVWWNDTITFMNPAGEWRRTGERLYKARWNEQHPFRGSY